MTEFQFSAQDDEYFTLSNAVYQALGAASMCWTERPTGIFDGTRADQIGKALIHYIENEYTNSLGVDY